ncbi:MAG: hypothetical protein GXC75_01985 [Xanthomonadaceae bacterium]|nr:hypothetical protein [Xanthomonadaceae bacterium]
MQPDTSGAEPKDLQFRSHERIAADHGIGTGDEDARRIARLRRRWRWLACAQVLVIVSVTGWVLFTQHHPGLDMPVPTYMMCLLMMAAGGISVGVTAFRDIDDDLHPHRGTVARANHLQLAPVAGLVGWGAGLVLFWRYLHGWEPGKAALLVTNPFGMYFMTLGISLLAMPLIVSPLVDMIDSLRGDDDAHDR